jgi:hypothetical protein
MQYRRLTGRGVLTSSPKQTTAMKHQWCQSGRSVAVAVACLSFVGCFTAPPPQNQGSIASYVGDRMSVTVGDTVVSVRVRDEGNKLHNLHVGLGAIINPRDFTFAKTYDVADIVRRQQARINAEIVNLLTSKKGISMDTMSDLKAQILGAAQDVFSQAYAKWSHAKDFEIQIVVTTFYLTDLSVAAVGQRRTAWWE